VPAAQRDRKFANAVGRDLRRWIDDGYARAAKQRGTFLANLVDFLSSDSWEGVIRRNDFTTLIEVVEPFPPQPGQALDDRRALRDPDDILECLLHVQANGFPNAGKGSIWDALNIVAKRNAYHPVTEWLRRLEWEGEVRLNRLFLDISRPSCPTSLIASTATRSSPTSKRPASALWSAPSPESCSPAASSIACPA
jgi:hypothetical protein